jgi:pimeloyl-ACP methyl ester carboxylesterase
MSDSKPPAPSVIPPPLTALELAAPFDRAQFALGVDGTRLFTRSANAAPGAQSQAPTALFCDGIGCDGFIWKYMFEVVAQELALTHWHYRGHGRSATPRNPERLSIGDLADDLQCVRTQVATGPVVLFGHSMGNQVCLEHYHRYPDSVRAMVLVCGSFGRVTQTVRNTPFLDMALPSLLSFVDKYADVVRAIWTRVPHEMAIKIALKMGDLDPDHTRMADVVPYMAHMSNVDVSMFLRMLRGAGEHSGEDYLAQIRVPVLIIAGEKDTFTPAWLSESMAARIPGAELLMVPGGSHASPLEQPDLVAARLREFLQKHGSFAG